MFSRFQEYYRLYRVLQSVTECYRVLKSFTEFYRVLQSNTEYYRVSKSITEYYRVLQSIKSITKTNLAHLLGPIFGLVLVKNGKPNHVLASSTGC